MRLDYRCLVDREQIARARRRAQALDALEFERILEADGWHADEAVFRSLADEDTQLLRRAEFAPPRPDEETREDLEEEIARLEGELAECRQLQQAYERYLEALDRATPPAS